MYRVYPLDSQKFPYTRSLLIAKSALSSFSQLCLADDSAEIKQIRMQTVKWRRPFGAQDLDIVVLVTFEGFFT